jgi:hypothetical protein
MLAIRRCIRPSALKLPVLVAVAAKPIEAVVVPLIGEANRDAVLAKGPKARMVGGQAMTRGKFIASLVVATFAAFAVTLHIS